MNLIELQNRNLKRFQTSIENYSSKLSCTPDGEKVPVPRLPNIKMLKDKFQKIVGTLKNTINSIFIRKGIIKTLFIFNNNEKISKLVVKIDNTTNDGETIMQNVYKIIEFPDDQNTKMNAGHRKRNTRKNSSRRKRQGAFHTRRKIHG